MAIIILIIVDSSSLAILKTFLFCQTFTPELVHTISTVRQRHWSPSAHWSFINQIINIIMVIITIIAVVSDRSWEEHVPMLKAVIKQSYLFLSVSARWSMHIAYGLYATYSRNPEMTATRPVLVGSTIKLILFFP